MKLLNSFWFVDVGRLLYNGPTISHFFINSRIKRWIDWKKWKRLMGGPHCLRMKRRTERQASWVDEWIKWMNQSTWRQWSEWAEWRTNELREAASQLNQSLFCWPAPRHQKERKIEVERAPNHSIKLFISSHQTQFKLKKFNLIDLIVNEIEDCLIPFNIITVNRLHRN